MAIDPSQPSWPDRRSLADLTVRDAQGDLLEIEPLDLGLGTPATAGLATPGYWVSPIPGLSLVRLFRDPFLPALPVDHPYASRSTSSVGELSGERWVTTRSERDPSHALLLRAAAESGFQPRISVHADDYTVAGSLIAAGIGIGLVPQLAISRLASGVQILKLNETIARDVSAVVQSDGSSVTATVFMRHLHRSVIDEQQRSPLIPPEE